MHFSYKKILSLRKKVFTSQVRRIMRYTFIFTLIGMLHVHANVLGQRISLSMKDVTVKQVLKEIEKQCDLVFMYDFTKVDVNRFITIHAENESMENILETIVRTTDSKYEITNKQIVLIPDSPETISSRTGQSISVRGTVKDREGEPIPGVNVVIKGTSIGVVTDMDGSYTVHVPDQQSILFFSFVGYATHEVIVGGRTVINIILEDDTKLLDDIVVTALGVGKQKRSLSYSTEQVQMDAVNSLRNVNLGESLTGKIAGVNISSSSGATGVGGAPRIIIRGDRSIANNNQPLIVVDGVHYGNDGGALSTLNSDDIESMNILKGPSAAALYGSAANNGVIVVTTKKGKAGTSHITFNSVSTFDTPYLYPEFQNEYGQGLNGTYFNEERNSWGPKITGQTIESWTGENISMQAQPNNYKDVFSTGYNLINSVSYSTGNEKLTGYFSYSNTTSKGVIENNTLQRNNLTLRLTSEVTKKLKADLKMVYYQQTLNNAPAQGYSMYSPMSQLLRMPRTIRTRDIEDYVYYDEEFSRRQRTWAPGSTAVVNPYWSMYGRKNPNKVNALNSVASLRYDFTDFLYVQLRGNIYMTNRDSEEKIYNDTPYINYGKGGYNVSFAKTQRMIGDVLVGFDKDLNKDFHLNVMVGAEINDVQSKNVNSSTGSDGLTSENKFALTYGISPTTSDGESRIQKQAVYGTAQLSFRNMLYLDVTGRNDWSSTLPSPHSYFYPSVGLVGVVSEMVKMPDFISFLKLRGTYAEVGNDAGFARIYQTFSAVASGPIGFFALGSAKNPTELIPEKTKSWEAGGEIKFFENRLGLDLTLYKSNTYNQLLRVTAPPAIGYKTQEINCGNIQNKGIEIMLSGTPVRSNDFEWSVYAHFSKNKNKVKELSKTLKKFNLADVGDMVGTVQVREGEPFGQIYARGFVRNDAGKVVVDNLGYPMLGTDPDSEYMGNMNYDWQSGITNSFSYKNWSLSCLVDLNYGGVRLSSTESTLQLYGNGKNSLYGREGFVFDGVKEDGSVNDITITAQNYAAVVAGRGNSSVGELYEHKATNARLRELSVGYTFRWYNKVIKDLQLSLVGRNLFFFYNGCKWFDPDMTADPGKNGISGENAVLPYSRTFGLNLKVTL